MDIKDILGPFVPPPKEELDAATEEAITSWGAELAAPGPWTKGRLAEIDGIAAILSGQFPDTPPATLGRVLGSASMALTAIAHASAVTLTPLDPADLSVCLGMAGARLATAGGAMASAEEEASDG